MDIYSIYNIEHKRSKLFSPNKVLQVSFKSCYLICHLIGNQSKLPLSSERVKYTQRIQSASVWANQHLRPTPSHCWPTRASLLWLVLGIHHACQSQVQEMQHVSSTPGRYRPGVLFLIVAHRRSVDKRLELPCDAFETTGSERVKSTGTKKS